jgi:hypothetical protein
MKNSTISATNLFSTVPGLENRVVFLAWKHRRESPIISVTTPSIGADAVDAEVTVIPRAQWMQVDQLMSIARACFARSDFNEDGKYIVMISDIMESEGGTYGATASFREFFSAIRLIHDSVFTTLTADTFAAELLRRERFPLKTEIVVRLHDISPPTTVSEFDIGRVGGKNETGQITALNLKTSVPWRRLAPSSLFNVTSTFSASPSPLTLVGRVVTPLPGGARLVTSHTRCHRLNVC